MKVKEKRLFTYVSFEIQTNKLLLVERPEYPTAKKMRSCINGALLHKQEISGDHLMRGFTMVTDGSAVM